MKPKNFPGRRAARFARVLARRGAPVPALPPADIKHRLGGAVQLVRVARVLVIARRLRDELCRVCGHHVDWHDPLGGCSGNDHACGCAGYVHG